VIRTLPRLLLLTFPVASPRASLARRPSPMGHLARMALRSKRRPTQVDAERRVAPVPDSGSLRHAPALDAVSEASLPSLDASAAVDGCCRGRRRIGCAMSAR